MLYQLSYRGIIYFFESYFAYDYLCQIFGSFDIKFERVQDCSFSAEKLFLRKDKNYFSPFECFLNSKIAMDRKLASSKDLDSRW